MMYTLFFLVCGTGIHGDSEECDTEDEIERYNLLLGKICLKEIVF